MNHATRNMGVATLCYIIKASCRALAKISVILFSGEWDGVLEKWRVRVVGGTTTQADGTREEILPPLCRYCTPQEWSRQILWDVDSESAVCHRLPPWISALTVA